MWKSLIVQLSVLDSERPGWCRAASLAVGSERTFRARLSNACVSLTHSPGNHPNCCPKSPSLCFLFLLSGAGHSYYISHKKGATGRSRLLSFCLYEVVSPSTKLVIMLLR